MTTTTTPHRTGRGAPHTQSGRWAVIGMAASWAALIGLAVAFALGLPAGEAPGDALVATVWATLIVLGAGGATFLGLRAMLTLRDRAGSVIAATVLAGLLLLVVLREVAQGLGILGS